MSTPPTTPKPLNNGPNPLQPDEEFWERYSPNQEFPLSWAASVAIHIALFLLFLFVIRQLSGSDTPPTPPMRAIALIDDGPEGQSGGSDGGSSTPKESVTEEKFEVPVKVPEARIAEVQNKFSEWAPNMNINPELAEKLAQSPNMEKFSRLGDKLRKDLLAGLNEGKGGGNGEGKGGPQEKGTASEYGPAADSSARRSIRWTLNFEVTNGADWLTQFSVLKASLLFPMGKSGDYIKVSDCAKPREHQRVTDLPQESYFVDDRRKSVAEVANACGLDFIPSEFLAFFPKVVEEELAAKERDYRGRAEKDIIETDFRILIRNGKPIITVTGQKAKR